MEKFNKANPYNLEKKSDTKKPVVAVVLIIAIIALIIKCGCGNDNNKIENKYSKSDALIHAHVFIEKKLKAPATAKFFDSEDNVNQINDTIFKVSGTVDSQNSFGVMIRSSYSCKITFHPKSDTHDIENFTMN